MPGPIPMDWKLQIKNFDPKEWLTDFRKVDFELVKLVDELASFIKKGYLGAPAIVHVAYEASGHTKDSQHYDGKAVDIDFRGVALFDQFMAAERFPFTGIGVYPFWKNPGLHLDIRDLGGKRCGARWWKDEEGMYQDLNDNLFRILLGDKK